jgi:serine/threonine protein kinase
MAKNEAIITNNLRNKNCIRGYGYFELPSSFILILEYATNRDLSVCTSYFYQQKLFTTNLELKETQLKSYTWFYFMSESLIRFFFIQILNALDYLRKMNFIHKDLKLENLLLMKDFQIKLSDFALSTGVPLGGEYKISYSGTANYMGPECFEDKRTVLVKDAYKIDYYALGVILHKLFTNTYVIKADPTTKAIDVNKLKETLEMIKNPEYFYERRDKNFSEDIFKLINRLLEKDVKRRADLSEIIHHPWVNKNVEELRFIYSIHDHYDFSLKFLLELQKMDYNGYSTTKTNKENKIPKVNNYHIPFNKKKKKIFFQKPSKNFLNQSSRNIIRMF